MNIVQKRLALVFLIALAAMLHSIFFEWRDGVTYYSNAGPFAEPTEGVARGDYFISFGPVRNVQDDSQYQKRSFGIFFEPYAWSEDGYRPSSLLKIVSIVCGIVLPVFLCGSAIILALSGWVPMSSVGASKSPPSLDSHLESHSESAPSHEAHPTGNDGGVVQIDGIPHRLVRTRLKDLPNGATFEFEGQAYVKNFVGPSLVPGMIEVIRGGHFGEPIALAEDSVVSYVVEHARDVCPD